MALPITTIQGVLPLGRFNKGRQASSSSSSSRSTLAEAPSWYSVFGYNNELINGGRRAGEAVVLRTSSRVRTFGAVVNSSYYSDVPRSEERMNLLVDAAPRKILWTEKLSAGNQKSARKLIIRTATSRVPYNMPQEPEPIPFWLWICIYSYQTVRDAFWFLREQPGQLQYIEWPSLQSTIKMAMLTVVVVAFLIIFLNTIDSTFSFVLSSILRRLP